MLWNFSGDRKSSITLVRMTEKSPITMVRMTEKSHNNGPKAEKVPSQRPEMTENSRIGLFCYMVERAEGSGFRATFSLELLEPQLGFQKLRSGGILARV